MTLLVSGGAREIVVHLLRCTCGDLMMLALELMQGAPSRVTLCECNFKIHFNDENMFCWGIFSGRV